MPSMYCYDLGLASELFFLQYLRAAMLLQKEGVVTSVHGTMVLFFGIQVWKG